MISAAALLVLAPAILAIPLACQNARQYTVYNKCPTPITLFIGGVNDTIIPTNEVVVKTLANDADFFYTDANSGSSTGIGTMGAGFHYDYYYLVADPSHVNTNLQVRPTGRTSGNGFCKSIECDGRGCPQAFSQLPTTFPTPTFSPPTLPYNRCPGNTDYDIIFCPTGKFPDEGQPIHFDYLQDKCLDVQGAVFNNGSAVQIYDCNGTQAQRWIIGRGSTKVQLAGTNFCLDAGSNPTNGVPLKIWQCYDNLPAQQWYFTDDNRIALKDQGFCTDLQNGVMTNTNGVQIWKCSDNNDNQVWTL